MEMGSDSQQDPNRQTDGLFHHTEDMTRYTMYWYFEHCSVKKRGSDPATFRCLEAKIVTSSADDCRLVSHRELVCGCLVSFPLAGIPEEGK